MRAVYDLIKWGPTAMNTQPLRVALVRSARGPRAARGRTWPRATRPRPLAAPLVAVLAADLDFHDELPKIFPVIPGAREAFADEDDARRRGHVQHLAADRLLPRRRPRRRAWLPVRWAGSTPTASASEFFPDGRHRALLVVNIGHPSDEALPSAPAAAGLRRGRRPPD